MIRSFIESQLDAGTTQDGELAHVSSAGHRDLASKAPAAPGFACHVQVTMSSWNFPCFGSSNSGTSVAWLDRS